MEELLKDNYLIIILLLSVISVLLFVVVLVDQLYIKKNMKKLKGEIQELYNWYNKNVRPYQKQQGGVQQTVRQPNSYQQMASHTTHGGLQPASNGGTTTNSANTSHNNKEEESSYVPVATSQTTNSCTYNYLQEANGGKFLRLMSSPEKCFFRTWEESGVRKYEFCGNVAKALANINAIFDDVCEIEGKRSGATDIENVAAGILDSELRITCKAKIRLK